jgi:predicted Zn finger-like uncharacterized protein
MSFITRCPTCSTSFKVVADQLRVSQGWVRCGHCAEIFDANQDIKPWVPTPPVLTNVVDEQQQPPDHAWARQARESEQGSSGAPFEGVLDGLAVLSESTEQRVSGAARVDPTLDLSNHPTDPVMAEQASSPSAHDGLSTRADETPLPIDVLQADRDEPAFAHEPPEPRFVQEAKRQVFWSSSAVRTALWTGVALGVMGLTVQWAVHDRHRLAAWQPTLKPVLESLCQCEIGPYQQLDAVVIESSGLVRLLGQLHALDVVVKNTHDWPVAMPSLELSLTDAQEAVFARRVLLSQDWPDAPTVLAPGQSWPVKLRLSIALQQGQIMTGYRVALFYP